MSQSALHHQYTGFIKLYVIYIEFVEYYITYIGFIKYDVIYSCIDLFLHFIHHFCRNTDVGHINKMYRYKNVF
jgi:hypothetical protein